MGLGYVREEGHHSHAKVFPSRSSIVMYLHRMSVAAEQGMVIAATTSDSA